MSNSSDERARWMSALAKAKPEEVIELYGKIFPQPTYKRLRGPEMGTVMLEGRTGGDGSPFNLGEACVTRCSVRTDNNHVGHSWVIGRHAAHAERAAVIDALMQDPNRRPALLPEINRLEEARNNRRREAAVKTANTKVDFFTVVRGDD